jgi:hypothetical protein
MVLEMDNKGGVDLANNYSVGGRTWRVVMPSSFSLENWKSKTTCNTNKACTWRWERC